MKIKSVILTFKISMVMTFYLFSFIPLINAWLNTFTVLFVFNAKAYYILGATFMIFGIISTFGILTLKLTFRALTAIFFSLGIIFSYSSPYFFSLGIVLSWFFYEIWRILYFFSILDKEYEPYDNFDLERIRVTQVFKNQIVSLSILAWIAISLSWLVLFIASIFYIQLGKEHFGTIGISLSAAMLLLLYLVPRYTERKDKEKIKQYFNQ
ncbi:MAG: hypothetical protein ACTSW1_19205 [Candidatus Hodarchaeales archaeon]